MKRILAVLPAACLALAAIAAAMAHAEPAIVSPGSGANVVSNPGQIQITMSQEMFDREGANDIDVIAEDGTEVTRVAAAVSRGDRRNISVALPADLQPGAYTVRWKTLSAEDGDTDEGEYTFTYDPSRPADPGQTNLREDVPAETPANGDNSSDGPPAPAVGVSPGDDGMSWILVTAVGIAGLALGSGATFLLVQRRG
jgi:methionine-rich copper-binding protein CopC